MAKVLGQAIYSAYRQGGVLHIVATGQKPYLQTQVLIEQLPIFIYPPRFGLFFDTEGIVSPVVIPFEVEKAFLNYPPNAKTVTILDASGLHTITIETRANVAPPPDTSGSNFCVFQQIATDHYIIAKCDAILPAIYYRVFGPATYQQCQQFIATHSGQSNGTTPSAPAVQADPASFHAWFDELLGGVRKLIVIGNVQAEIDYQVTLVRAVPQGINPNVLLLHIDVEAPSGKHSNAIAQRQLRYEESPPKVNYTDVTITGGGAPFTIKVGLAQ